MCLCGYGIHLHSRVDLREMKTWSQRRQKSQECPREEEEEEEEEEKVEKRKKIDWDLDVEG